MLTLRQYQIPAVEKAVSYLLSNSTDPALIVLPTGWGKSVLTAFVAAKMPENERLIVVQPSKELLEQNYKKYIDLCGSITNAGIYSASFGKKQVAKITYATIGSIKKLGKTFKELGFTKMLIDEAHLYPRKEESMLGIFLKESGIRKILGITATPLKLEQFTEKQGERFDSWSELTMLTNPSPNGCLFKSILYVGQISEMTTHHYWSPLIYKNIPFDKSLLRYNSTESEYSENSMMEAYAANAVREKIHGTLDSFSDRQHVLVFVPSVDEANQLASTYPGAEAISGITPAKERTEIIKRFREGKTRVLFNCSVLSVGFDYPKIDMIILGMSTSSVARYYQILGRGVRTDPGKNNCLIVDLGGNIERFGKIEDILFKFGNDEKWRMYGSGGIVLCGLPICCLGKVNRNELVEIHSGAPRASCMSFGKYKNTPISLLPTGYKKWAIINCDKLTKEERYAIIYSLENRMKDTTALPPETFLPDGKYSGCRISSIPKHYLIWYYKSKKWNKFNDSLKRGIEEALKRISEN